MQHPNLSVPLATHGGWSLRRAGFAPGEVCNLSGSYIPLAASAADRAISGDPRLSVEERYGHHGKYVGAVARAANRLVRDRLLLPEDAEAIVDKAAESQVGK